MSYHTNELNDFPPMKLSVLSRSENQMSVRFENVFPEFVNDVRRMMLDECTSMRLDSFFVYINTTSFDSMPICCEIALKCKPKNVNPLLFRFIKPDSQEERKSIVEFNPYEESSRSRLHQSHGFIIRKDDPLPYSYSIPEPDSNLHLVFRIDVMCHEDLKSKRLVNQKVYANQLCWVPMGDQLKYWSKDHEFFSPTLELLEMTKGQRFKAEIHMRRGSGREHAKFLPIIENIGNKSATKLIQINPRILKKSPVKTSLNELIADIEDLEIGLNKKPIGRLIASCPKRIFRLKNPKCKDNYNDAEGSDNMNVLIPGDPQNEIIGIKLENPETCNLCMQCTKIKVPETTESLVSVTEDENDMILTFRTYADRKPEDVLSETLELLVLKTKILQESIETANTTNKLEDNTNKRITC